MFIVCYHFDPIQYPLKGCSLGHRFPRDCRLCSSYEQKEIKNIVDNPIEQEKISRWKLGLNITTDK